MIKISVIHIDAETNKLSAMDVWGRTYNWDLTTEVLPKYINDFIASSKVSVRGSRVTYK